MKKQLACLILAALPSAFFAQNLTPEITSWIINPGGETGFNNLPSNVQSVRYSADNVYVAATCIPGYDIGPWAGNPNTPANQNFVFKITRHPQANAGTPIATPLGHIGIMSNGVSLFNAKDGMSWQNQNIWLRNAIIAEGPSFDDCLGHPAPNGEYHNHLNPTCLYDETDFQHHSPIIGFAFDGFPIYGAIGRANPDGTGDFRRIKSSYRKRNITARQTLPDGTQLAANQYGPAVSTQYPVGLYLQDFEYVAGLGDLDEHNGRFCITPEYPDGTYAYFVTLDEVGDPAYPYLLGPTYYGTVQAGNTGPQSGHNTPTEPVTTYNPVSAVGEILSETDWAVWPNPAMDFLNVGISDEKTSDAASLELVNVLGQVVRSQSLTTPTTRLEVSGLPKGQYAVVLQVGGQRATRLVQVW